MRKSKTAIEITPMRSPCPIANVLDIIGDKWTLLILRDLFADKNTYGEFQASPESIPTNILADRLKRLVRYGIVDKQPYQERPVRYAYELTARGREFGSVLNEIRSWGLKHIKGTQARIAIATD